MKKAASIFLLFILSLISSCKKDCYRDLTAEEISRLGYKGGETLIFKSNTGLYDTANVQNPIVKQVFSLAKGCRNQQYSFGLGFQFKSRLGDTIYPGGGGGIIKIFNPETKSKKMVYPEISFYGTYNFEGAPVGIVNINGIPVNNVFALPTNGGQYYTFGPAKIWFNYELGILRIDMKDGTTWERINF